MHFLKMSKENAQIPQQTVPRRNLVACAACIPMVHQIEDLTASSKAKNDYICEYCVNLN